MSFTKINFDEDDEMLFNPSANNEDTQESAGFLIPKPAFLL